MPGFEEMVKKIRGDFNIKLLGEKTVIGILAVMGLKPSDSPCAVGHHLS